MRQEFTLNSFENVVMFAQVEANNHKIPIRIYSDHGEFFLDDRVLVDFPLVKVITPQNVGEA